MKSIDHIGSDDFLKRTNEHGLKKYISRMAEVSNLKYYHTIIVQNRNYRTYVIT